MTGVEQVAGWVRAARAVTVLTGAGISTDSGIPDFRGPRGVWTRDPSAQRFVTIDAYVTDPEVRRRAWQGRRNHPARTARPNAAHRALVDLERSGRLRAVLTQNIDGLHQKAGNDPALVAELHGSLAEVVCLSCAERSPMTLALDRVAGGEADPPCLSCGGILKSAVVFFGESLDPGVFAAARRAALDCDLFLAVGTSLTVAPASELPGLAASARARVVIVNAEPTPVDGLADAVLAEPVGEALPAILSPTTSG
ncbi:MAG TPA: Sir2 family NAD-dependent protein deacetylase [Mycobacteriales bacterium]|nr:Sir2 family NAD-dependent protein deacetylase [Mycobacteriales bacterium]